MGDHKCSMHRLYIYWNRFFHVFLKFKKGMSAVSSMTTPRRVYTLRIYSVVILVLAVNSFKMKEIFELFICFAVVERLCAELMSK